MILHPFRSETDLQARSRTYFEPAFTDYQWSPYNRKYVIYGDLQRVTIALDSRSHEAKFGNWRFLDPSLYSFVRNFFDF